MFTDDKLPEFVYKALSRLEENGYSAYVVGGAVRDIYMNKIPKDFDITTTALPDDVLKIFSDCITVETGKQFGTITVITDGNPLEITTYRSDGNYLNNRSPENVSYSKDISEDLKRRDFTVNALAYSPKRGFIDLFCGQQDINNKIIRSIGNADERFSEDALRILRAIRFSSMLGFGIEENTGKSIFKNKNLLLNISKERIRDEFNRIITGKNAESVLISCRSVIEVFIPEIKKYTEYSYSDSVKKLSSAEFDTVLRLSVFLKPLGSDSAANILKQLKYDNKTVKNVKLLIRRSDDKITAGKPEIKLLLNKLGTENTKKLFDLKTVCKIQPDIVAKARKLSDEILYNKECFMLKDLDINGSDLIPLGFSGSNIGEALEFALIEVIYERVKNKKEAIINCITEKFKNGL